MCFCTTTPSPRYSDGKPALVFCGSKKDTETLAGSLAQTKDYARRSGSQASVRHTTATTADVFHNKGIIFRPFLFLGYKIAVIFNLGTTCYPEKSCLFLNDVFRHLPKVTWLVGLARGTRTQKKSKRSHTRHHAGN